MRKLVMVPKLYFLAADTARARAYFDFMQREGVSPSNVLLLQTSGAPSASTQLQATPLFDNVTPLHTSVIESGVSYQRFCTPDVNAEEVCTALSSLSSGIVIFAPIAGLLARRPLFSTGHKLLHIHPGRLPDFRGSTPIYYSLIAERKLSASAIFLEPEIDTGPVLAQSDFSPPSDLQTIDTIYDPYIRALLLVKVLKSYRDNLTFKPKPQGQGGTTYHVIHPVLKHLALMSNLSDASNKSA
jgi:methionyl-tRNA formyltransferase